MDDEKRHEQLIAVVIQAKVRAEKLKATLNCTYGYATASQLEELVDIFLLMLSPMENKQ